MAEDRKVGSGRRKKAMNGPHPDKAAEYAAISDSTVQWFRSHQRDLPFRRTKDPYAILVSELMLQQTQVVTAIGYYERFLKSFPTIQALAAADEQAVLAGWAGLGYYRRARLLQAAAKKIVQEHGGRFPESLEEIEALPGVGRYTAGAVYSFAYDKPAPIVEANTARLLARLFAIRDQLDSGKARKALWGLAQKMVPVRNCREHNYAMMELGSLVCKPVPKCDVCPLTEHCGAYRTGQTQSIPRLPEKPEKLKRSFCGVVARSGDHFLVRQIPKGEWHAGMFEFPTVAVDLDATRSMQHVCVRQLLAKVGVPHGELMDLARFRYTVTRHSVVLDVLRCEVPACAQVELPFSWLTLEQIDLLPLGSTQRKLLDLLKTKDDLLASVQ